MNIGTLRNIGLLLIYLLVANGLLANQSIIDSLKAVLDTATNQRNRVITLQELALKTVDSYPKESQKYSVQSLQLAKELGDSKLIGYSFADLAFTYYARENLDSFRIIQEEAIAYFELYNMPQELPTVYRNLAKIGEASSDPDTSLYYLDKCIEALKKFPDSLTLGDVHLSKGFAYRTQGYYNISLEELFTALKIFEQVGSRHKMSYAYQNIGINNAIMEKMPEAIRFSLLACEIFEERGNLRGLAQTKNNLGKMYEDLSMIDSSRTSHRESLIYAEKTNQQWVIKQNCWNLGRMEYAENRLDSAQYWLDKAMELAIASNDLFIQGGVERYYAHIALQQNNQAKANLHIQNSLKFMDAYRDPNALLEAYNDYSKLYETIGDFEKAIDYKNKTKPIQDSLFSLKKDQQIAELNLIYNIEKKDSEIKILSQQAEIDQAQKRILWGGILFTILLGGLLIFSLWQKRKKDHQIYLQEKDIEIEKRRNAELALEFKKKELTAKVLQLAKKNEFLQELEDQVKSLKSTGDDQVRRTSQRLSRMINHDNREDEEWEQFVQSFTSVHQGFIDGLIRKHGPLSKNDLRLVSLLKMNLSSKDIANTLRISPEGIKKARYRLRKKLALDSSKELQEYLHAFN